MLPVFSEPAITANDLPQPHAVDRAATGIGTVFVTVVKFWDKISMGQQLFFFCWNCSDFIKLCSSVVDLFYIFSWTEGLVRRATGLLTLAEKESGL